MPMYDEIMNRAGTLADVLLKQKAQATQIQAEKDAMAQKAALEQEKQANDIATLQNLREQGLGARSLRVGDISVGEPSIKAEDPLKQLLFNQRQEEEKRRIESARSARLAHASDQALKANIPSIIGQATALRNLQSPSGNIEIGKVGKITGSPLLAKLFGNKGDAEKIQQINKVVQAYRKGEFGSQFTDIERKEMNDITGSTNFWHDPKLMQKFIELVNTDALRKSKAIETPLVGDEVSAYRQGIGLQGQQSAQPSPADLMKKLQEMEARRAKAGVK